MHMLTHTLRLCQQVFGIRRGRVHIRISLQMGEYSLAVLRKLIYSLIYSANYAVAALGAFHELSGTSASAPTVAAILTAVNDARLAIGKKPIGFINPTVCVHLSTAIQIT